MNFLASLFSNPWLATGSAAASIPVIIHLLNKQRFKRVTWAAMHWLWASFRKSQKRLQVEQLLLLIIRTLIILLLALALARPVLQRGAGLFSGRPASHRVIVLDNSYSMGQLVNGKPLFEKAKELASELAGQMTPNDELDVLLTGTGSAESARDDLLVSSKELSKKSDIVNAIKGAQLGDGGTDIPHAIAAACKVLNDRKTKNPRKEIVVITDNTRNAWTLPDHRSKKVEGADETAVATAFGVENSHPKIVVMRLPGDKDTDNFAATALEIDEKVLPARVDKQIAATIHSFASQTKRGLNVKLKIDNEEVLTEALPALASEKPENVSFRYSFNDAGSHAIVIEADSGDVLPADNSAYLAVDVEDQLRVLCVDGQQRAGPNASAMDFLRQALSPSKSEEIKAGKMPLYPEVISDSAFPEANLDNYRLIALANVAAAMLPKEKIQALGTYVKQGGSLLIFCGDRVDPAIYNRDLNELLPMALGELVGNGDPDGPRESISDKALDHPAIAKFRGIKGLNLSQLQTFRRFKFMPKKLAPGEKEDDTVRTVLSYENGDPAAVEKKLGEGRIIVFGTSADKSWNNWPGKTQYMPLVNFVALDLINPSYLQRNKFVGDRFVIQIKRADLGAARREGIRLTDPSGEAANLEINIEQSSAESAPLKKAGIYTAVIPGETKRLLHFAVNRHIEESDLSPIEERDILSMIPRDSNDTPGPAALFKGVVQADFSLVRDDLKAADEAFSSKGGSKEFWRWLATAVLILVLVESILAKRFGNFSR